MADTLTLQLLDGDTSGREWAKKVHQYVLGLEEQSIFSPPSVQLTTTSQQGEEQVRY